MDSKWETVPLEEFVSIQRGHDLPTKERENGSTPVMGSSGLTGWHNEAKCDGPGVTIGRSGASIGNVCYQKDDFWPLNTTVYVTDFKGNDERYSYFALSGLNLERFNSGTAQPSLNRNYISHVEVPCPPIKIQKQIANILGAFDEKIDQNKIKNQIIEELAKTIFEGKFIEFEEHEKFKNSEKGIIPSTHEVAKLPELMDIVLGGTPQSDVDEYYGGGIRWAKAKDVSQEREAFISSTEKTITEKGLEESSAEIVPKGTTVITARGTVGETALTPEEMATNQTCYGLVPKNPEDMYFLYFLVHTHIERLRSRTHGTVFDTINMNTLREQEIVLPPKEERLEFHKLVEPMLELILSNQRENKILHQLRELLLPKLVSGELKPKETDFQAKLPFAEV